MIQLLLCALLLGQGDAVQISPGDTRDAVRQNLIRLTLTFDSVVVNDQLISYHARAISVNGLLYDDAQIFFSKDTAELIYLDTKIADCRETVDSLPRMIGTGKLLHFIHGPINDIALVRFPSQDVAFLFKCSTGQLRTEMARTHRHPRFGDL
jgi:hypothetical protein